MSEQIVRQDVADVLMDGAAVVDDFDSWTARLALTVLVDDALADPEVRAELRKNRLDVGDAKRAVLGSESALARLRLEQARPNRFSAGRRRSWREFGWLTGTAAVVTGYSAVLRLAWTDMPWPPRLVGVLGLLAVLVLAVGTVVRRAPTVLGELDWRGTESRKPHEQQLALGDRRQAMLAQVVLPELRDFVERQAPRVYGTTLTFTMITGLYDEDDTAVVPTAATTKLRRIVDRSSSGAVALTGPRGVGKTTAIRAIEGGLLNSPERSAPLVVVAAAPTVYDGREFVLHLHARLCAEVATTVQAALRRAGVLRDRSWRAAGRIAVRVARFLLFVAVSAGAALLLWGTSAQQFFSDVQRLITRAAQDLPSSASALWTGQSVSHLLALVIVGLAALRACRHLTVAVGAGIGALVRRKRSSALRWLYRHAREQQNRIRFLLTFTTGWSGKLSMPFRSEAGRSRSVQKAEQQLTYPDVVDQFRRFARISADVLHAEGVTERVVVAVDELDRIERPDEAQRFVNDVKGAFEVAGCHFIVSVSDDAMLSFEQRGLAVRDAFDSTFSESLRLEHFTLTESRAWVRRRLVNVPEQFCVLCHCLSGGLARDLKRRTVDMVEATATDYEPSLSEVAETLIRQELSGYVVAVTGSARQLEQTPELLDLTMDLLQIADHGPERLTEIAQRIVRDAAGTAVDPVHSLRWQSGCVLLYCATMLDVFDDSLTEERLNDERFTGELSRLATARLRMRSYPRLAWQELLDFRKEFDLDMSLEYRK